MLFKGYVVDLLVISCVLIARFTMCHDSVLTCAVLYWGSCPATICSTNKCPSCQLQVQNPRMRTHIAVLPPGKRQPFKVMNMIALNVVSYCNISLHKEGASAS